ncbi:2-oxoglutarate receptor 1-like [Menidia menidia]
MACNNSSHAGGIDRLMKLYYLPACYSLIFMVGLLGNTTSVAIYLTKLRPWKSSSILMVNLALADLLYVLTMPFLVSFYVHGDSWELGDFMCRLVRFGFHFHLYGGILFLTCHAVFRCAVVVRPLGSAQVQRRSRGVAACSAVWALAAAGLAPMWNVISLRTGDNRTRCLDFASTEPVSGVRLYSWLLAGLGFLLPLVVVFACYICMAKQLAKGPDSTSSSRRRARRAIVLVLAVFVVCFLPYHVLRVLWIETQIRETTPCTRQIVHTAYIVSRPLAGLNTLFNLALYTFSGKKFQRALQGSFHWERWLDKARSLLHRPAISRAGSSHVPAA